MQIATMQDWIDQKRDAPEASVGLHWLSEMNRKMITTCKSQLTCPQRFLLCKKIKTEDMLLFILYLKVQFFSLDFGAIRESVDEAWSLCF
jgi:hypothetical protein